MTVRQLVRKFVFAAKKRQILLRLFIGGSYSMISSRIMSSRNPKISANCSSANDGMIIVVTGITLEWNARYYLIIAIVARVSLGGCPE